MNESDPSPSISRTCTMNSFKALDFLLEANHYNRLNLIFLNIRSLRKSFEEFLIETSALNKLLDVIIFVETNIKDEEIDFYKMPGYHSHFLNRTGRRGGGIAIFVRDEIRFDMFKNDAKNFECLDFCLEKNNMTLHIIAIYRPPTTYNTTSFTHELRELIEKKKNEKDLIVIGDINIDILKENGYVSQYLDMMAEFGMENKNPNEVTREDLNRQTSSNIDHVFIRSKNFTCSETAIIQSDISDHYSIFTSVFSTLNQESAEFIPKYIVSNKKVDSLIQTSNWRLIEEKETAHEIYNELYNKMNFIYEKAKFTPSEKTKPRKDWATPEVVYLCRKRNQLFKIWKKSPNNLQKRNDYCRFRNMVNKKIAWEKNKYIRERFDGVRNDVKKTWQLIHEIIGSQAENPDAIILKNIKDVQPQKVVANFALKFEKGVVDITHQCHLKVLEEHSEMFVRNSIYLEDASMDEIRSIVTSMSNKGPGSDSIRIRDLKANINKLLPCLTKLINTWMKDGKMPIMLKSSIVRPIYKNGSKSDYNNYRPISILPAIEKIMEEVLVRRITDFIRKYKIIDDRQYGFQKGKNINQLLGKFANRVNENLSNNLHSLIMFIDFSKAFDTIPHDKLLKSLERSGLRGQCYKLLQDYLKNRTFAVKVGTSLSTTIDIKYGVPQGSKLGPILFLLYANDMIQQLNNENVFAYADDTAIINSSICLHKAIDKCQKELDIISKWCHDNGLIINARKTKIMYIRPNRKSQQSSISIYYRNFCQNSREKAIKLEIVGEYKYLGVTVDQLFNWHTHVANIRKKLRKACFILNRLSYCGNNKILKIVYHSLAESHIRYGITAWGSSTHCSQLQRTHNTVLRILRRNRITSNFLDVEAIHKVSLLCEFDICDLQKIDHPHQTRANEQKKLKEPAFSNLYGKNSLKCMMPRILNSLPQEIRQMSNSKKRGKLIKNFFMGSY